MRAIAIGSFVALGSLIAQSQLGSGSGDDVEDEVRRAAKAKESSARLEESAAAFEPPPPEKATGADPAEARQDPGPAPAKKTPLRDGQITPAIQRMAASFLDAPMGSERTRSVSGMRLSFKVEPHYHEPGSGKSPEGWHKGVTVYRVRD